MVNCPRGILVLPLCLGLMGFGCKSPTTSETPPPPPPPPTQMVKILTTVSATFVFRGLPVPGTVTFYGGTPSDITKPLGEEAYLGDIPVNTTKKIRIVINCASGFQRDFNDVPLGGTQKLTTTVIDLNEFNFLAFFTYFLENCGGYDNVGKQYRTNNIWNQPNITLYFNPDSSTGSRLPQEYVQTTVDAVNEIKGYSKGFIQSVSVVTDGNKPDDDTVPPDGEIWVYRTSERVGGYAMGIANKTYPVGGDVVKAAKLWYNIDFAYAVQGRREVMDAFIQGSQFSFIDGVVPEDFELCLYHRPKGNAKKYKIFLTREEMEGFDGTIQQLQSLSANGVDDTVTATSPPRPGTPFRRVDTVRGAVGGAGGDKKIRN